MKWDKKKNGGGAVALALASLLAATAAPAAALPIIELRDYTLYPGQREMLITLFEQEFIEPQEALGMQVVGTFRDLDRPDHFVWIRAYRDMASRGEGLNGFYFGPIWKAHREAANATIADSDNVLLLHEAAPGSGFAPDPRPRPSKDATAIPKGLVVANIYAFDQPVGPAFTAYFDREVAPRLRAAGVSVQARFVTEAAPNNFPRLPVREKDQVFVWFASFPNLAAYERSQAALAHSAKWRDEVAPALARRFKVPPQVLRLVPTARSKLHG